MSRFPDEVSEVLRAAGWAPGRRVSDEQLQDWSAQLEGFVMSEAAAQALREFGGLSVDQRGPGLECARAAFEIDPVLALYENDRFDLYRDEYGVELFPLGEAAGSHYFLAIDPAGRTYLVMDDILVLAESFDAALEALVLGRRPVPLD
jgi:hypothetical protein